METDQAELMGWVFCWAYALVWLLAGSADPPLSLLGAIVEPPAHGKYIPGTLGGLFMFGAAPFMRRDGPMSRKVSAAGIALLILPGIWIALQGAASVQSILIWLVVPLAIAAWVLVGPRTAIEGPNEASRVERERPERDPPLLFAVIFFGMMAIGIVAGIISLVLHTFP